MAGWCAPRAGSRSSESQVLDARDRLRSGSGRPCNETAIADALDVPVQDVVEALRAEGCFSPRSLDVPLSEGGSTLVGDAISDPRGSEHLAAAEARVMLRPLVRCLSDRDRSLLRMRFFEERTQQEIGEELGRHSDPGLSHADTGAGRPTGLPLGVTDREGALLDA